MRTAAREARDDGVTAAALRFVAAEKRLVRVGADDAGGGGCDPHDRGTIVSITSCAVRQWRIRAVAARSAAESFYGCHLSRRLTVAPHSHTVVAARVCGGAPGEPGASDLFAA